MNTPFSDYSHPSYYYRLFHEGRNQFAVLAEACMVKKQEVSEDGWKRNKPLLDSFFFGTSAGDPAQSVDPLDGVW